MSLDVYLDVARSDGTRTGIFIREDGRTRELTRAEWDARFPGCELVVADSGPETVFERNITHNLGKMADAAGIYRELWRPEEIGITTARQLIEPLAAGLQKLQARPAHFRKFDAPNGWGLHPHLVAFVEAYLAACRDNPDAKVRASR